MASDFGTSSPTTIDTSVASTRATTIDTVCVLSSDTKRPTSGSIASRHGGLGDEADDQRGDRDAELRAREVERQAAQRRAGGAGPAAAGGRVGVDPRPVDGDERELDRDEEPGGEDEQECGQEAEGGLDGVRPWTLGASGQRTGRG